MTLIDAQARMTIERARNAMTVDEITGVVVDTAVKIHRDLRSDLFESVYEIVLAAMLERRGLRVERQRSIGFTYSGIEFDHGFRADLVVEGCVLIELKVVERLLLTHRRQLLTYLRLSGLPVGLLLNFGAPTMKEGVKRLVNDLPLSASSPLRINRLHGGEPQPTTEQTDAENAEDAESAEDRERPWRDTG